MADVFSQLKFEPMPALEPGKVWRWRQTDRTTLISIEIDRYESVPGYESWWDVPVAEVSEMPAVQEARKEWEAMRARERFYLPGKGE